MSVKAIPEGFNTVSVYLIVNDAKAAIDFYQKAFGAEAGDVMMGPDGQSVMHAEMRIGDSTVMLTSENPEWNMKSPKTLGGIASSAHLYVNDADAAFKRATDAGCEVAAPIMDAFWGDRYGKVRDPFGHEWGIATHKEDLTPEEIGKRQVEFFKQMAEGDCG
jgi:uncharacterized glyoxalase superfamily protein PhnB